MSLNTQTTKSAKKSFPKFKVPKTAAYDFKLAPREDLKHGKYINKKTQKQVEVIRICSTNTVDYRDNYGTRYNMKIRNFKHFYKPYERKDRLEII